MGIKFSYQTLVRYVANNCDSEMLVMYSDSDRDERSVVNNMMEYLGRVWPNVEREVSPLNWDDKNKLDIVRRRDGFISNCIEVKFVQSNNTGVIAERIIKDIVRVLSLKTKKSGTDDVQSGTDDLQRHVLVVGQREAYEKVWKNQDMESILPLEYNPKFKKKHERKFKFIPAFGSKRNFHQRAIDISMNKLGECKVVVKELPEDIQKKFEKTRKEVAGYCNYPIPDTFNVALRGSYCPRGDFEKEQDANGVDARVWKIG